MTYKIAPHASGMVNLEFFGPSLLWMGYNVVYVKLGLWAQAAPSLCAPLNSFIPVRGYVSLTHHTASDLCASAGQGEAWMSAPAWHTCRWHTSAVPGQIL